MLARRRIGMLSKIKNRCKEVEPNEVELLNIFINNYKSFEPFEEMICIKHNEEYIPHSKYHKLIIKEYEDGYKYAKDLFQNKEEYVIYAMTHHYQDEDVETIMLTKDLEII